MRIHTAVLILMLIGLSIGIGFGIHQTRGIGFGVYQTHDGKSLRFLETMNSELRARAISAEHAAAAALQQAREDRERLARYIDYIVGQVEAP